MSPRPPLHLDDRRESEFRQLLLERAQRWIPEWSAAGDQTDFAHALLAVAARYQAEVAERLDRSADKMALGFLDWLAVRGQAAIPARMPVVLQLAANASAVIAPAPVQLMADAMGTPVTFETQHEVHLQPGQLQMVVAADSSADAYYLPPPGLSGSSLPAAWRLLSVAAAGARTLQLDPALGLEPQMLLAIGGRQYRITAVNDDLVTIDPPFSGSAEDGAQQAIVRKVVAFDPFAAGALNRQVHALYLGHPDLLNIESAATIVVSGLEQLGTDVKWHYWGMPENGDPVADWQPFVAGSTATALVKRRGAIEERQIGALTSRWIRASIASALQTSGAVPIQEISIGVNPASLTSDALKVPGVSGLEALANTAPLELNDKIYPLGREPRLFDAFYLGSQEAFSKRGAEVRISVDMATASFTALVNVGSSDLANSLLIGVSDDGYLHQFLYDPQQAGLSRLTTQPPSQPTAAQDGKLPVPVKLNAATRPAVWSRPDAQAKRKLFIAVSAGTDVWMWSQSLPDKGSWTALGKVSSETITGLVYLSLETGGWLFALSKGLLYARKLEDGGWEEISVKGTITNLKKILAVVPHNGSTDADAIGKVFLAVDDTDTLYAITIGVGKNSIKASGTQLLDNIVPTVAPAGLLLDDKALLAVAVCAVQNRQILRAMRLSADPQRKKETPLEIELNAPVSSNAIDASITAGQPGFCLTLRDPLNNTSTLAWWSPVSQQARFSQAVIPEKLDGGTTTPLLLSKHIAIPTRTGQILIVGLDPSRQKTFNTTLACAVVLQSNDTPLALSDYVAALITGKGWAVRQVIAAGVTKDQRTMYKMSSDYGAMQEQPKLLVYRLSDAGAQAIAKTARTIELDPADRRVNKNDVLLIRTTLSTDAYTVTSVNSVPAKPVATLNRDLAYKENEANVTYWRPQITSGDVRPLMELDPATNGNWDASLLTSSGLTFPKATPMYQHGTAFSVDTNGRPQQIVLDKEFTVSDKEFIIDDGIISNWSRRLEEANPQLSWEYWNGTGWWKLPITVDDTRNLKNTGKIIFTIPGDMQPSEWAGKNNHWIRARLVGGDYGEPRTEVHATKIDDNTTIQTIKRFPAEVNAPLVLSLRVDYAARDGMQPTHVLTEDNGALRNQSGANSTPGAIVSVFTPLGSAMPATTAADGSTAPAPVRALYLGFSKPIAGQPVNLFALVDRERVLDQFAPLHIEALCGEHFTPVTAEDTTRALGESELLSLSLTLPTVPTALFGAPLNWLRLSPAPQADASRWTPALRGLYLNAVWASARETMTRERLGSSSGGPGQAFLLARPPILHHTLELRVREPLGDEELQALKCKHPCNVVSDVATDLPGHWVLWRQIADVDDAAALERMYALDETTGEVRFGDGIHGMIPPAGRDAVVAFTYQRTQPGQAADATPANSIAPLTPLNLTTPVEGVELVFAADQSASGAPPEDTARVRRFAPARLRHRGRAVTLRDFEALALESSPDIAQARAFAVDGSVRLIVVMRGQQPAPGQAARRSLRRRLLAAAAPQLAHVGQLTIQGPQLRRLRIHAALRVDTLDGSGQLANHARTTLSRFFDAATGGLDQQGWPLGAAPTEDDVALVLLDAPGLDSIDSIAFEAIQADGSGMPWNGQLRADQLAVLADDGVRVSFNTLETQS